MLTAADSQPAICECIISTATIKAKIYSRAKNIFVLIISAAADRKTGKNRTGNIKIGERAGREQIWTIKSDKYELYI